MKGKIRVTCTFDMQVDTKEFYLNDTDTAKTLKEVADITAGQLRDNDCSMDELAGGAENFQFSAIPIGEAE